MYKNCPAATLLEQSPTRYPAYTGNRYWRRTKLRTHHRGHRSRLRSALRRDIIITLH